MCCSQLFTVRTMDLLRMGQVLIILVLTWLSDTVEGEMQWSRQPTDQSVRLGGNVTFYCEVSNLNTSIVWNKGSKVYFINNSRNGNNVDSRFTIEGQYNLVIRNVTYTDDDLYSCNVFSYDSVQVRLTVLLPPGPPVVTYNTTSLSQLVENTVISLTCSTSGGKPVPEVKWLKNGQLLLGIVTSPDSQSNVTSSLIVRTLDRTDHNATYECVVTNSVNQDSPGRESRVLQVQYKPYIHFEPSYSPYNVKLNTAVTVVCVVDANPVVTAVEWTKDGIPVLGSSKTLEFRSIQKTDSGTYRCSARNVVGGQPISQSADKIINVIYAPTVTTQSTVVANISSTVNLSCEVDANPTALSIHWSKSDNSVQQTGPNLVFVAGKNHIGNYTCTARSRLEPSGGTTEEIQAKGTTSVFIRYPPGQASISPTSAVLVGQEVRLTCTVDDPGYPLPMYTWSKLGDNTILQQSTSPTFVISRSRLQDNGNYSCLPVNMMGDGRAATILVEVNAPPYFSQSKPSNTRVSVPISQLNFSLQHVIEGRPLPNIKWFKDGNPVSAMRNVYDIVTTSFMENFKYIVTTTLLFRGVGRDQNGLQMDDIGNYSCSAEASGSSPVTQSIQVSVEFAPRTTVESRVASDISQNARLTCQIRANPAPQVMWYKEGIVISPNSRVSQTLQPVSGIATYEAYLDLQDVRQTDFAQYECEASNSGGSSRKRIQLSVKSRPESPTNLSSLGRTWESVQLRWDTGFDGGLTQTFHVLINSIHGEAMRDVMPFSATTFNVSRLMPQTSYTFRVYGENTLGKGGNSEQFTAQTDVLVFPALSEVPNFNVEKQSVTVPNDLNDSYCLRLDISNDGGHTWLNKEQCILATDGSIPLALQTATDVNVSICLQYRKEVCGEPVRGNIEQPDTKDLTETQVIIIGCVCAAILIILLIILIFIICRRRQRKSNYQNEGGTRSQHPIQPVNGSAGIQKPQQRGVDNPGMLSINVPMHDRSNYDSHSHGGTRSNQGTLTRTNIRHGANNFSSGPSLVTDSYGVELENRISHPGYPIPYHPAELNMLETSYDSQFLDKRYEYEMNRRNANSNDDPYFDKPGDISYVSSHSPQTPTKDPKQFIHLVPEEHKGGSGNESGYSTPDPAKPKKT